MQCKRKSFILYLTFLFLSEHVNTSQSSLCVVWMAAPFMSALCDEQKKKSTQTPLCGDVTEDADLILWLVDSSSRRRAYNRVTQGKTVCHFVAFLFFFCWHILRVSCAFSSFWCSIIVSLCERWQQAEAAAGQTAIKIPPAGPRGHHKGLFDTDMSYTTDPPSAKHCCV